MNALFAFLDGRTYTHRGISGVLRHKIDVAIHPYPRTVEALYFEPDAAGQATEEYRRTRQELNDDWSTDLTHAIDTYCDIARALGYEE